MLLIVPRQRRAPAPEPDTLFAVDDDSSLVVFTDGSCLGNPGRGGWAWAVEDGPFASGAELSTTNQRMEVQAVLEALRALEGPLVVASDSAYVVNCFKQRWWVGWQRRNWRNSQGAPVANQDLWEPLLALALDPSRHVGFQKVQGHSGDPMNDLVDRLAVEAAMSGEGRSGGGDPWVGLP
jgi:ribonuclease HI